MAKLKEYTFEGYHVFGHSSAGVGTSLVFPELDFCFDVAQGTSSHYMSINNFLVSHGHLDHAAGIPYIVSQKSLNRLKPCNLFVPQEIVSPLQDILSLWMKIEDHVYPYNLVGVREGETYALKGDYVVRPFRTSHRVASYGYTVFRRTRKLKSEYQGLERDEIIGLREKGVDIHQYIESPEISFTGDTKIEFVKSEPWVRKSKLLFMEVTYLDEKKSVEETRKWGHTHLDEVIPILDEFECRTLVFIHFSRRYRLDEIWPIIQRRVPEKYHHRIQVLI